jgi:hypothetical protein
MCERAAHIHLQMRRQDRFYADLLAGMIALSNPSLAAIGNDADAPGREGASSSGLRDELRLATVGSIRMKDVVPSSFFCAKRPSCTFPEARKLLHRPLSGQ